MKTAVLVAVILLLAIFTLALFGNSIRSYVVKDVLGKQLCELNGQPCVCYSKECVCGAKIIPKTECLNRALA
jgi:hypothetical protein